MKTKKRFTIRVDAADWESFQRALAFVSQQIQLERRMPSLPVELGGQSNMFLYGHRQGYDFWVNRET